MKNISKFISFFALGFIFFVGATYGAGSDVNSAETGIKNLSGLVNLFTTTLVKAIGTLFMSGAVVAFFFGVVQYIWGARQGNQDQIKKGNQFMLWALIALFLMFSVYGIIKFVQNTIGLKDVDTIIVPDINFGGKKSDQNISNDPLNDATNNGNGGPNVGGNPGNAGTASAGTAGVTPQGDCAGLASESQRDRCFSGIGACDKIGSETLRDACFASQGGSGSPGNGDCAGLASESQRDRCFSGIGACDKIVSETSRDACFASQGGSGGPGN